MESIKAQAVEPLKSARIAMKVIKQKVKEHRNRVDKLVTDIGRLTDELMDWKKKLIEAPSNTEKLRIQTKIAENKGNTKALKDELKRAKEKQARVEKENVDQMKAVTDLEDTERKLLKTTTPAIRTMIEEEKQAKDKAAADAEAKEAADKAKEAKAKYKEKVEAQQKKNAVDAAVNTKVSEIVATAKKVADGTPLPPPPPEPAADWQWHGPKPENGELPPQPKESQVSQLKAAVKQSAKNLKSGESAERLAQVTAEAEKAKLDDKADAEAVKQTEDSLDKEAKSGTKTEQQGKSDLNKAQQEVSETTADENQAKQVAAKFEEGQKQLAVDSKAAASDSEDEDPDERDSQRKKDERVAKPEELEEDDEAEEKANKMSMVVDNSEAATEAATKAAEDKVKTEGDAMEVDEAPATTAQPTAEDATQQ